MKNIHMFLQALGKTCAWMTGALALTLFIGLAVIVPQPGEVERVFTLLLAFAVFSAAFFGLAHITRPKRDDAIIRGWRFLED